MPSNQPSARTTIVLTRSVKVIHFGHAQNIEVHDLDDCDVVVIASLSSAIVANIPSQSNEWVFNRSRTGKFTAMIKTHYREQDGHATFPPEETQCYILSCHVDGNKPREKHEQAIRATIKELGLPPPAYHRFQFKAHHLFGQENSPKEVDKVLVHGDGQNIAKCMANDYVVPPQASVPASSTPPSDNHQSVVHRLMGQPELVMPSGPGFREHTFMKPSADP